MFHATGAPQMRIRTLLLLLFSTHSLSAETAVTYEVSDGRFGDQLLSYLNAKWISYRYHFPLLYKPFLHAEQFALHEIETPWTEDKQNSFDQVIIHTKDNHFSHSGAASLLYVIPFFSGLHDDLKFHPEWAYFSVDWKDPGFRDLLRPLFHPRKQPLIPAKNTHHLSVAVHVRRGGTLDLPYSNRLWPLRFVPDSYYCECLQKLCSLFPNREIHAILFTDDPHPEAIAAHYQKTLSALPITFDYKIKETAHDLEDLFAMMQCDCLIRSESNYSLIPALTAAYKVVMTPQHYTWLVLTDENGELYGENYIDQIDIEMSDAP